MTISTRASIAYDTETSWGAIMDDSEYLGKNLNQRAYDVVPVINLAVETVMRQANVVGRLGSGNTIHEIMTQSLRVFTDEVKKGLQFAFNFTGNNDEVEAIRYFAGRVATIVMDKVVDGSMRLGLSEATVAPHVAKMRVDLSEKKDRLIEDFAHGMMGENRLKKDPVISVVNNQTNSPGAVQQVGFGNFSQTAFTQNRQPLIAAIDAALSSSEFAALKPAEQDGVRDIADALRQEAEKSELDIGKLKRWGSRLVQLTGDLGMRVASAAIAKILVDIFMGS
jgi:hypothetical protein